MSAADTLIVVSNRLPYDLARPGKRNVGGLVNAVEPVLAGRQAVWVGWDGTALSNGAAVTEALRAPRVERTAAGVEMVGVPLSEREVARFYHGFSNRALWPLFHGFVGKARFQPEDWRAYKRVNERFAQAVLARAGEGARVWVHDYHLMLLPELLRQAGFPGRIDFFLHIPFPAPEVFLALPWRRELIAGVLAADTVGFQVDLYRDNLASSAAQLASVALDEGGSAGRLLRQPGRETLLRTAPIGVDVAAWEEAAGRPEVRARAHRLREAQRGRRILFAADRLDYTKGIAERLHTFDHFLTVHPEWAGKVTLVQVVVPSRSQVEEYRTMKREIDREVGRINGQHAGDGWVPIHQMYRALDTEELVAHYLATDVALVTPLRDGMNLVASEFGAARTDEEGVLVLSEFAGVAQRLGGALRVNPYDLEGTAAAVQRAITMERDERRFRMRQIRERVKANPVSRWAAQCLDADFGPPGPRERARPQRGNVVPFPGASQDA